MPVPLPRQERGAALARLRQQLVDSGTAPEVQRRERGPADGGDIPVHRLLRPLVPGGVLARGTVVSAPPRAGVTFAGSGGISYLTLALIAGATAGGAWAAVIGHPNFGIAAAAGLGADLSKILLLDHPGDRWADAAAILAGAADLVLLHAPQRPNAAQLRRLSQRLRPTDRQRGCVLVVTSPWEAAHLAFVVREPRWEGVGDGTGNLTGRHVTINATGRAVHGQHRELELWLPASDGGIGDIGGIGGIGGIGEHVPAAVEAPGPALVPEAEQQPQDGQQPEGGQPRLRIA